MYGLVRRTKCLAGWICVLCVLGVLVLGCVAAARAAESEVMLVGSTVVRLRGGLPDAQRIPLSRRVAVERWDRERVAELYGLPDANPGLSSDTNTAPGDAVIPVAEGGLVRLRSGGESLYYTGRSPYGAPGRTASCDTSEAIEIAREYIASHGGMPTDAELWSIRDVMTVDLAFSAEESADTPAEKGETVARYLEFRHRIAGLEVDGPDGGDHLKVRVDTQGVVHAYGRAWTVLDGPIGSGKSAAISARTALAKAIADGGGGKARLAGSVELKDARLVYVRSSGASGPVELRPAWRFVVDGGTGAQRLYVDATEGEVLDER